MIDHIIYNRQNLDIRYMQMTKNYYPTLNQYTTLITLLKIKTWKYLMKKQKYLLLEGRVPSKICLYNKLIEIGNSVSYLRYSLSFTHDTDNPNKINKSRKTLSHIHMYRQTKQIPLKHLHKTEKQSEPYNNSEINQIR
jgi:hypothetical protein